MAKTQIKVVENQLKDIQDQKYERKLVEIWNLETGKRETITKFKLKSNLRPKRLFKVTNTVGFM